MTRREMLRAGTLGGATAVWMAPAATIHAMSQTVAEPTSGLSNPDEPDTTKETTGTTQHETTEPTEPRDTTDVTQPEKTTEPTQPGDTTETTKPDGGDLTQTSTPSSTEVDVLDTEVTATTFPDTPISNDVTVAGKVITTDVGNPSVSAPAVNPTVLAQTELPKTGFDADRAAMVGTALTGIGAALLAATREQPDD